MPTHTVRLGIPDSEKVNKNFHGTRWLKLNFVLESTFQVDSVDTLL